MNRNMNAVKRESMKTQGHSRREERLGHPETFRKTNGDRLRKGDRRKANMQMRSATGGDVDVDINNRPSRMSKSWH